jgi:ubiquinone/menaquinone biosynthesis C-methylase UbiE
VQPSEYDKLDKAEDRMWWFAAVHANLLMAAQRGALDEHGLPILDAGCGTGGFLSRLAETYRGRSVVGLDCHLQACARAAIKSASPVCAGSIEALPFHDGSVAAIFSADVLCHAGVDEVRALHEFRRCLCRGGRLLLNLPAYRWMLSRHDAAVSNARRYTATGLRRLLEAAGFRLEYLSYWNTMLFPLMVITRKLLPADLGVVSDVKLYSRTVDTLCRAAMACETALMRQYVRFPFGGSILAVAGKADGNSHE